ncbi:MAG TPA: amidohydrolase, partial [Ktedonosporobacter sp.]|nr:amidohydrolase [Ktedonosporobacter sp.]
MRSHSLPRLADLIIRAGAIYAMTPERQVFRAIAVRDEWIVAVSEDPHGLDSLISEQTRVLDEPGLTLLPALEDTHNHFILAAQNSLLVPVDRARNLSEFVELIRQQASRTPPGEWIRTSDAWHDSSLQERRLPTAPEIDAATRDHPVLVRRGGHVVVANSLALQLGGITRETPDPPGGTIGRFPDGTPNGLLIEPPAFAAVASLAPAATFEQMVEGLKQACQNYNAYGIGSVRDPLVSREQMRIYQALWEQGELTVRSRIMLAPVRGPASSAEAISQIDGFGVRSGFGDDLLKIWGLKFGLDGGAEGAALEEPYINDPQFRGHLLWSPDDLFQVANFAVRQGWRIGTHAVGDRAVRTVLDVYEQIIQGHSGLRPGTLVIEHAFLANAEQRARAIRLGVAITVQHPLLYTLAPVLLKGWGEARTRQVMPMRAWLEEGAMLSAGTDYPVSSYDPMLSIWGLVTRGTQLMGVQGPEYAIDRYTALQLYTAAGAELNYESERRGTLQPH